MMSYRIASKLGRSVEELSASISHDEWIGWIAYWQLEPWGCAIEDDRFEKVCRLLEAQWGGKPDPRPFFDRDPKPVPPQSLDDKIKGGFARFRAAKALQEAEEESDDINT